jgi:hypothetical protein
MSSIPPLQPSTPANEWGTTTLNEMDERAKQEAASTGALLTGVPGVAPPPAVPVQPIPTAGAATTLPPTTTAAAPIPPAPVAAVLPPATVAHPSIPPAASTIPPAPVTHSTISSGTYDATYNPTLSTADRYNEGGATVAPAQVVQTPGLDIPGGFPTSIAEFQSTQAGQQAQAALAVASEKGAQAAQVASEQGQAALAVASEKGSQAAQVAAEQAQAALAVAGTKLSQALSGAAQYLPQSLKEQVAPYLRES